MDKYTIIIRITITFVLALIFGLERQKSHKPIGFGTFTFVSLGSCALSLAAVILTPTNPLPLLAAIITGIGFLGAGALMKTSDKIFGFTSASSIWIFSILGLLIGVGEYFMSILIYITIWIVIYVDKHLEKKVIGAYQKKLIITTHNFLENHQIISLINTTDYKIVGYEQKKDHNEHVYTLLIPGTDFNTLPKKIFENKEIKNLKIE